MSRPAISCVEKFAVKTCRIMDHIMDLESTNTHTRTQKQTKIKSPELGINKGSKPQQKTVQCIFIQLIFHIIYAEAESCQCHPEEHLHSHLMNIFYIRGIKTAASSHNNSYPQCIANIFSNHLHMQTFKQPR